MDDPSLRTPARDSAPRADGSASSAGDSAPSADDAAPSARDPAPSARDEPIGVLHLVDCLDVGGTERQLFELLRRLDRRRFRPYLACFKGGGELQPRLIQLGLDPTVFPLRGTLLQANTAYQIARMALLCKRTNIRLIHAHDFYSNLIGVAAANMAGARSIASRRDLAHWLSQRHRRALRLACHLADAVIANAAAVAAQTARDFGVDERKLHVVPNGIDVAHFDLQAFRTPDPLLPTAPVLRPRVVMVGSMHRPDKGHADLLEAAALLKQRGRRAQWLLVSDGALRPQLEAQARALDLDGDVCFLGRRDDVPSVLVRSDVAVHPSWAEGFPNAVLEAMCAARPVVATRVGGIPEVLRDGVHGILVTPQRPSELAAALECLLARPLSAHVMGLRARRHVEAEFSLDQMCATVQRLYASLTGAAAAYAPAAALAG
jgi:glycosyltransferase involved in cell wall biosynthesis